MEKEARHLLLRMSRPKGAFSMMLKLMLLAFLITLVGVYVPENSSSPMRTAQLGALAATTPDGTAVFKAHCTPCHGADGKGITAVGTPDFTSTQIQASLTDDDIIDIITNGKKGTIMPAWKGKLSPEEISAAESYVRSLGRPGGRH
jgi:cbb3-type cytochrome c oxidase subunit III